MNAISMHTAPDILAPGTPVYLRSSLGFVAEYKPGNGRQVILSSMAIVRGDYVIVWESGTISELPDTMAREAAEAARRGRFPDVPDHAERYAAARRARHEAHEKAQREREQAAAEAQAFKADALARMPAWAKAAIVADLMQDESDSMSDYFNARTVRTVILAWSPHERDLFPEMRKAARHFPETAHLADGPDSFEHRNKWSMGAGYFLSAGGTYSSGWRVRKVNLGGKGVDYLPVSTWALAPDAAPAKLEAKAAPVTAGASVTGARIEQHTHSKHGFSMWLVILPDRVPREEFDRMTGEARALGGWYSRPWGGTPGGFAFKVKANAERFAGTGPDGDGPGDDKPDAERAPEAPKPPAKGNGDKLRALADAMQEGIDHAFRDRLANTPKRQREAQSARLEGLRLTRAQAGLRALASMHDAGTVPRELAHVTTRKAAYELAGAEIIRQGGYYDAGHESGKPSQNTEAARLFWSLAADAGKAEREAFALRQKIEALRFANIPGYFPTPRAVVARMLDLAEIEPGALVLEPSAGHGAILDEIKAAHPGARLVAFERHSGLAEIIKAKGYMVDRCDFLEQTPDAVHDRVMMNPPFEGGQDMQHVRHAFAFLKPGGRLVAVMSPGPFFRGDAKAREFRDWFDNMGGEREELPAGSFKESGTGVGAVLVRIRKGAA